MAISVKMTYTVSWFGVSCNIVSYCTSSIDHFYECKDITEETKDLSCQCSHNEDEEPFNCTCYTQQVAEDDEPHYLNCLDAEKNGETESGIYVIKPDDLLAFRVSHHFA